MFRPILVPSHPTYNQHSAREQKPPPHPNTSIKTAQNKKPTHFTTQTWDEAPHPTHPHKQNSNPKPTPTNTVSDQQTVAEELQKLEKLGFDSKLMDSATYNHKIIQQTGTQTIITILLELSEHYGGIRCRLANTTNPYPKHKNSQTKSQAIHLQNLQKH